MAETPPHLRRLRMLFGEIEKEFDSLHRCARALPPLSHTFSSASSSRGSSIAAWRRQGLTVSLCACFWAETMCRFASSYSFCRRSAILWHLRLRKTQTGRLPQRQRKRTRSQHRRASDHGVRGRNRPARRHFHGRTACARHPRIGVTLIRHGQLCRTPQGIRVGAMVAPSLTHQCVLGLRRGAI